MICWNDQNIENAIKKEIGTLIFSINMKRWRKENRILKKFYTCFFKRIFSGSKVINLIFFDNGFV